MVKAAIQQTSNGSGAMAEETVRTTLEDLIRRSGGGYAAVSRLLGRNPAYIQQFIKRGVPKRLDEADRRRIAQHFGVDEARLGAPLPLPDFGTTQSPTAIVVPFLGPQRVPGGNLLIDSLLLAPLIDGEHVSAAAHIVSGDSMAPTVHDGDLVLIDIATDRSPRDGIHLIDSDGMLLVKRLSVHPVTRRIAVTSDNAAYPSFPDCDPAGINIVGRVIWFGRRLP